MSLEATISSAPTSDCQANIRQTFNENFWLAIELTPLKGLLRGHDLDHEAIPPVARCGRQSDH